MAHNIETVDEGVELLHLKVIGDERFRALGQAGDGELHRVIVKSANTELFVLVGAAHIGHLFNLTCACAKKGKCEVRRCVSRVCGRALVGRPCGGIRVFCIETGTIVVITGEIEVTILHLTVVDGEGTSRIDVSCSIGNITDSPILSIFLNRQIILATLQFVGLC